ncbi:MAG: nucleotidyltransferase domain-containing protein [Defluviitaleaceae bacterium]|nr:nucleotidyltransferase domain-containing protein [Defluviitaleaceae bacterium]
MRFISSLDELLAPKKHKMFLDIFINNASRLENAKKIERIILFGSCARGEALDDSDIDIAVVGDEIDDVTLGDLYYCVPDTDSGFYVESDIIALSGALYDKNKDMYGMVQKYIERDGVDISGLLQLG